jgi:Ca2+-binding EF-hand superfamily protein
MEHALPAGELGAAVQLFDLDRDGKISCNEFMAVFCRQRSLEISRLESKSRRLTEARRHEEEQRKVDRTKKALDALKLNVGRINLPELYENRQHAGVEDNSKVKRKKSITSLFPTISKDTKVYLYLSI